MGTIYWVLASAIIVVVSGITGYIMFRHGRKVERKASFEAGVKYGTGLIPDEVIENVSKLPPGSYGTIADHWDSEMGHHITSIRMPNDEVRVMRLLERAPHIGFGIDHKHRVRRYSGSAMPSSEPPAPANGKGGSRPTPQRTAAAASTAPIKDPGFVPFSSRRSTSQAEGSSPQNGSGSAAPTPPAATSESATDDLPPGHVRIDAVD